MLIVCLWLQFCHMLVCPFCSCGTEPHVLCKDCQPQVRGAQPAFSLRQLLWRLKMLPFGCHGEKWLYLVRKRQACVVPTDLKGDEYQWLVHQLPKQRQGSGTYLEQEQTLDRVSGFNTNKTESWRNSCWCLIFGCVLGCRSYLSAAADTNCPLQATKLFSQVLVLTD